MEVFEIRSELRKSRDPEIMEVANDPSLLSIISEQFKNGQKLLQSDTGQAVLFGANQIGKTIKLAKNVTPAGVTAILAQKFLLSGKLIAKSDLVKCGIAVSYLAAEGTIAVAAGIPTGGGATAMMAIGVVASAYSAYDSCKEVSFK